MGRLRRSWLGCVQPDQCLATTCSSCLPHEEQGVHCVTVRTKHLRDVRHEPLVHGWSRRLRNKRQFVCCVPRRMGLASLMLVIKSHSCCLLFRTYCHSTVSTSMSPLSSTRSLWSFNLSLPWTASVPAWRTGLRQQPPRSKACRRATNTSESQSRTPPVAPSTNATEQAVHADA